MFKLYVIFVKHKRNVHYNMLQNYSLLLIWLSWLLIFEAMPIWQMYICANRES